MIPEGMRDVLPAEVAEVHAIEELLRRRCACYGYGEVRTPTLEFAEMLQRAGDDNLGAGLRLFDEQGRVLMLRTDMTVPVARLAATRFRDKPLPLRFCYVADSFRPLAVHRGQHGEFAQAGAELLGLGTAATDAEVVTLLCDALAACGLPEFRVSIGTTAFHAALVASLQLTPEDAEATLEALAERDYPLLETIVANAGLGDDARRAMEKSLERAGGRESLAQARRLATTGGMDAAVDHSRRCATSSPSLASATASSSTSVSTRTCAITAAWSSRPTRPAWVCRSPRGDATTVSWRVSTARSPPSASPSASTACTRRSSRPACHWRRSCR